MATEAAAKPSNNHAPAAETVAVKPKKTYTRKKPEGTAVTFYIKSQHELSQLSALADADSRDINGMALHLLRKALRESATTTATV